MVRIAILGTLVVVGALFNTRDVAACSCVGPEVRLLSPDRVDDVPLNVHVRVDVPLGSATQVVLRRVSDHGVVLGKTTTVPQGGVSSLEIEPSALAPKTQYEVATVDPAQFPSTTVFGTFTTGDASDTTAPKLESLGAVAVHKNTTASSSMCQAAGPWVNLEGIVGSDPGRPDAQLGLAVWLPDASGKIDETKRPSAIEPIQNHRAQLGRSSICQSRALALPGSGQPTIALALVDEANNRSAVRRIRVDLTNAAP